MKFINKFMSCRLPLCSHLKLFRIWRWTPSHFHNQARLSRVDSSVESDEANMRRRILYVGMFTVRDRLLRLRASQSPRCVVQRHRSISLIIDRCRQNHSSFAASMRTRREVALDFLGDRSCISYYGDATYFLLLILRGDRVAYHKHALKLLQRVLSMCMVTDRGTSFWILPGIVLSVNLPLSMTKAICSTIQYGQFGIVRRGSVVQPFHKSGYFGHLCS